MPLSDRSTNSHGPTTSAIAPWFGSNRTNAAAVGAALGKCAWVGIPFAGGCCEILHIKTRAGVANDLHRHLINLCRVIADAALVEQLARKLADTPYHPDVLSGAQKRCIERECAIEPNLFIGGELAKPLDGADIDWAYDYFVCCWMARSAKAGTRGEFTGGVPVRFTSSGGDSVVRFRSAADSLAAWHRAAMGWNFTTVDAFDFIARVGDEDGHAIYSDAPWPDDGADYSHPFEDRHHRRLAAELLRFVKTRVVIRFGDHPLIRELYPGANWHWSSLRGRDQANAAIEEVLIMNKAAHQVSQ